MKNFRSFRQHTLYYVNSLFLLIICLSLLQAFNLRKSIITTKIDNLILAIQNANSIGVIDDYFLDLQADLLQFDMEVIYGVLVEGGINVITATTPEIKEGSTFLLKIPAELLNGSQQTAIITTNFLLNNVYANLGNGIILYAVIKDAELQVFTIPALLLLLALMMNILFIGFQKHLVTSSEEIIHKLAKDIKGNQFSMQGYPPLFQELASSYTAKLNHMLELNKKLELESNQLIDQLASYTELKELLSEAFNQQMEKIKQRIRWLTNLNNADMLPAMLDSLRDELLELQQLNDFIKTITADYKPVLLSKYLNFHFQQKQLSVAPETNLSLIDNLTISFPYKISLDTVLSFLPATHRIISIQEAPYLNLNLVCEDITFAEFHEKVLNKLVQFDNSIAYKFKIVDGIKMLQLSLRLSAS